jgi:transcriptional regulator with XRE-family HTH domain
MDEPRILRPDRAAVRAAREDAGFTKYGLAKALGCSRSTITDLESGRRNTTRPFLARVAEVCGVPIDTLKTPGEPEGAPAAPADDRLPEPELRREDRSAGEPATEEVLEVRDAPVGGAQ